MPSSFFRYFFVLVAAGYLTGCDTPQKRGLRELSKAGIEPTGTALLQAVAEQNSKRAGWLIDVGVYTEQRDAQGRTPLRVAMENRDLSSVFKLLDGHANINASAPDNASILGIAVELGETAIVDRLLAVGANAGGLMRNGEKILPWAIRNGRMTFVRSMLKAGADPHLKDRAGDPLLHIAMATGRRDLVDTLIELGADPGATNAAGETTIEIAMRNGWQDAVPKLAAAGADPNVPCRDGKTLLDRAITTNDVAQVSMLLGIGADPNRRDDADHGMTPLERVLRSGNSAMFDALLAHGAKPAQSAWEAWLWTAFKDCQKDTARMMLEHGARGDTRSPDGSLLVEQAVRERQGSFVKLLTDFGCPMGDALYQSVCRGDRDMVGLLTSCGAEVNVTRVPTRDTPLSAAIRRKYDEVASLLIHNGADISLRLPEGQPALHVAIATGCHRTVKDLLDAGVNPNMPFRTPISSAYLKLLRPGQFIRWVLRDERNVTPLMLAADSGVVQTARHLIRAGAKTEVWTRGSSLWPINFASNRDDVKMMKVFLGKDPLKDERHIDISLSEQKAHLYDAQGNEIFTTKVSTGRKGFATRTGEFVITNKHRDWTSTLYHASMPYFQRLSCSDFGMHQGVVPDYPASHGCIRVPAGNAAKLFALTEAGDRVRIMP